MTNYTELKRKSQINNELTYSVVDEFLMYYAAGRENLDKEMKRLLAPYRHITSMFDQSWVNMMKAQYITHQIFKRNGLINKYLNHSAVKDLSQEKQDFLEEQTKYPWRFSFSIIINAPEEDFYEMVDVFRNEKYLLYSPGITRTINDQGGILWFNLISYNGGCWETYGPIQAYNGFEPDDIFFYATELFPSKWFESDEQLMQEVEKNPFPFMMLASGATHPIVINNGEQIVYVISEWYGTLEPADLKNHFKVEYNEGVYRLSLKHWDVPPHSSIAYFDEEEEITLLTAATDNGYDTLVRAFHEYGYDVPSESHLRVNPSMLTTIRNVLGKDLELNEYEKLFEKKVLEKDEKELEKFNEMMQYILPDINKGEYPDVKFLAEKFDLNEDTTRDLIEQILAKLDQMGKPPEH